jgi:dCTP deaminase
MGLNKAKIGHFPQRSGMILAGKEIQDGVKTGRIVIDPFDPARLGPNSYDFSLGDRCRTYIAPMLDVRLCNETIEREIDDDGLLISPSQLFLVNTRERIGSTHYVPIIRGRSSTGRLGLFIDITADLIDVGSINQLTLQLHSILPVRIYPGMIIGQVTFWLIKGDVAPYRGKYGNLRSPAASLSYLDFAESGDCKGVSK